MNSHEGSNSHPALHRPMTAPFAESDLHCEGGPRTWDGDSRESSVYAKGIIEIKGNEKFSIRTPATFSPTVLAHWELGL